MADALASGASVRKDVGFKSPVGFMGLESLFSEMKIDSIKFVFQ
jgi:hypothetical protein